jgi:hypothetical protein
VPSQEWPGVTVDGVMSGETFQQEMVAAAEQLLQARSGGPVCLGEVVELQERSNVLRAAILDGPAGMPSSVVIKRADLPYEPDASAFPASAWLLFNNWAGLEFLNQVDDGRFVPRIYGGDRKLGLVVMEDYGSVQGLHDLLLGEDADAAEQGLLAYARLLGGMHASTAGRQAGFDRIRQALGPNQRTEFHTYAWLEQAWTEALDAVSVTPRPGASAELQRVIASMRDPGPFLVYTHGDPCPDNCLFVDGQPRLIDLDIGEYRHAFRDGVYGRIHFPTCWCVSRMPARVPRNMEAVYRAALVQGCPEAADDTLFQRAVVEGCVYWLCEMFRYPIADLLREDLQWGRATRRQRYLVRLAIVAEATEEYGYLEAIGATFRALAERLTALWEDETDAMLMYPAFRQA